MKLSDEGETTDGISGHAGNIRQYNVPDITGRGGGADAGALGFDHVAIGGWDSLHIVA